MVDKDFVAVDYARRNAEMNGLRNCEAILSNGLGHVPEGIRFDNIASNLPAKVGNELFYVLFTDVRNRLKPGRAVHGGDGGRPARVREAQLPRDLRQLRQAPAGPSTRSRWPYASSFQAACSRAAEQVATRAGDAEHLVAQEALDREHGADVLRPVSPLSAFGADRVQEGLKLPFPSSAECIPPRP